MDDLISRQAAIDAVGSALRTWSYMPEWRDDKIAEAVVNLPSAQRERGKWIPQNMNKSYGMISTAVYYYPKCSVCGQSANYMNFCPNCGADMRGEQDG